MGVLGEPAHAASRRPAVAGALGQEALQGLQGEGGGVPDQRRVIVPGVDRGRPRQGVPDAVHCHPLDGAAG